jgi:hypothetical protein
MAQISQTAQEQHGSVVTPGETGVLSMIDRHRKAVLSSPFILAAALGIVYVLGGDEVRQVLDFMSPGHIFGR